MNTVACYLVSALLLAVKAAEQPNILFLWADDLGYGDLGCYGHPTSVTPHIDRLCSEGKQFASLYTSSPVCSPSRAGLLTGRYQMRSGVYPGVFWPGSVNGLPHNETTLAEHLREGAGYETAMVGKWHLGVGRSWEYIPTRQGFQRWFGLPYSHDMPDPTYCFANGDATPGLQCFPGTCPEPMHTTTPTQAICSPPGMTAGGTTVQLPLFDAWTSPTTPRIVQQPVNLTDLDAVYTDKAVSYVKGEGRAQGKPWFLYVAFQHTHHPNYAGAAFFNTTDRGMFGDSLAALDWCVGEILGAVESTGQTGETFVFFSSDNGPSLTREQRGGSPGILRCGKGTTWEGGQRVPGIIKWPGHVTPGRAEAIASTLDLFVTIANLVGVPLPRDRVYDGYDMGSYLFTPATASRQREVFYYWTPSQVNATGLYAVRWKEWKLHYFLQGSHCNDDYFIPSCRANYSSGPLATPLLFNLNHDPGEAVPLDVSDPTFKYIWEKIETLKRQHLASEGLFGQSLITGRDPMAQPCCNTSCKSENDPSVLPQCCRTNPY